MDGRSTPNFSLRDPFSDSQRDSPTSSVSGNHNTSNPDRISITRGSVAGSYNPLKSKHIFKSYKLNGEYEKPWIHDKRRRAWKKGNYVIWTFVVLALLLSAYINFTATRKATNHQYCLVLDDDFKSINKDVWTHEVQVDGFGTGSFDWTTTSPKNSFTDGEGLHIVPTLTTETSGITRDQLFDGYTLNLTKEGGDGTCTGTSYRNCAVKSNGTTGIVIPPVQSARLSTKGKKGIKYGRVEVVAKLPVGDWIWPAIWMMPEDSVYGVWPRSGEIDIMESRGNDIQYELGGRDIYASSLHWGPSSKSDAYWRATRGRALRRTDYSKGFHTFGLEWSEKYLYTYIDSRLQQVLYLNFRGQDTMWERGKFPQQVENSTLLQNPWSRTGRSNSPFDEKFYLILNVAVGSKNGWFLDSKGEKPWLDSGTAASDFYKAHDKWLPTWGQGNARGMTIKSVKMWQEGKC